MKKITKRLLNQALEDRDWTELIALGADWNKLLPSVKLPEEILLLVNRIPTEQPRISREIKELIPKLATFNDNLIRMWFYKRMHYIPPMDPSTHPAMCADPVVPYTDPFKTEMVPVPEEVLAEKPNLPSSFCLYYLEPHEIQANKDRRQYDYLYIKRTLQTQSNYIQCRLTQMRESCTGQYIFGPLNDRHEEVVRRALSDLWSSR